MEAAAIAWVNASLTLEDAKLALFVFPANSILSVDDIKKLTKSDLEELSTHPISTALRPCSTSLSGPRRACACVQSSISDSAIVFCWRSVAVLLPSPMRRAKKVRPHL
jgi:hypothetical protein